MKLDKNLIKVRLRSGKIGGCDVNVVLRTQNVNYRVRRVAHTQLGDLLLGDEFFGFGGHQLNLNYLSKNLREARWVWVKLFLKKVF